MAAVVACAIVGCRERSLQPDAGAGTLPAGAGGGGVIPTGAGGGAPPGGSSPVGGLSPGGGDSGAGDGSASDVATRPDSLDWFRGSLTENTQCHDLPNTAPYISPLLHGDQPTRSLAGGVIADGRYELISDDYYNGGNGLIVAVLMRRTIEFREHATIWLTTDFVPDSSIAGTNNRPSALVAYVAASNTLRATIDECYARNEVDEYQYEATPETLTTWNARSHELALYLRVE